MKDELLRIINEYLVIYSEKERLEQLVNFINKYQYEEIINWNNFDGHIVASGFIYDKAKKKFLVLYHKDMKTYLYPGGHIDKDDENTLLAAKREVKEETGIDSFDTYKVSNNELVPFDIDTHIIPYNERLDLKEHYHYDFRYLFITNNVSDIKIDEDESLDYKWVSLDELSKDNNYKLVSEKLRNIIQNI